jgi:hypothetical protein
MSLEYSRQSIWRKAWSDYILNLHSIIFWVLESITVATSGVLAKIFASPEWSEIIQTWFTAGIAIAAGLVLALGFYLVSLLLAPIRLLKERDKVVRRLQAELHKETEPRLAQWQLQIDHISYIRDSKKTGNL